LYAKKIVAYNVKHFLAAPAARLPFFYVVIECAAFGSRAPSQHIFSLELRLRRSDTSLPE
jgi:hypothetical protein